MGASRNGARTLLDLLAKCCKLSRLPGFQIGIGRILGADEAIAFFAVWNPLCAFVDVLLATDDHFNRVDATDPSETGGEDNPPS